MAALRYCAVPLITVDPFFSIWSMTDELYADVTRHWTGRRNPMSAGIYVDGSFYALMGQAVCDSDRRSPAYRLLQHIPQKSVSVTPTRTRYLFENEIISAELIFTSPLLLDRLDILSRPVSYLEYHIRVTDGKEHEIEFYFDMSTECCVDTYDGRVWCDRTKQSVYFGKVDQKPLERSGDSVCIDWGYLHISEPDAQLIDGRTKIHDGDKPLAFGEEYKCFEVYPYVAVRKKEQDGVLTLGYDDIYAVEYFGTRLFDYYRQFFADFEEMFAAAIAEYELVRKLCIAYDERIMSEARRISVQYEEIVSLAYRQSVAAHKLTQDREGHLLWLSKECHSNGCIGTLDVTYETAPIFYQYCPELVFAMLRPIARYADSPAWEFDFVPHDVGQYPRANGQVYGAVNGVQNPHMQMPLEECGNMLLCAAAAVAFGADGSAFLEEYAALMKRTADYLVENGYDPALQLCTDDFTGHFAHSCNLSLKAILGIAAYGRLYRDPHYTQIAADYAARWEREARGTQGGTRLAFDQPDSWSLKYNMVWDKLLGFGLFGEETYNREVQLYKGKLNRYGVPLDMRADFTVIVWVIWTTVMSEDQEYRDRVIGAVYDFINETPDRVPITDWYCTSVNRRMDFQNRPVVGGMLINLLCGSEIVR